MTDQIDGDAPLWAVQLEFSDPDSVSEFVQWLSERAARITSGIEGMTVLFVRHVPEHEAVGVINLETGGHAAIRLDSIKEISFG